MAMIDCPECGHSAPAATAVCPKCGHPIHRDEAGIPGPGKPRGVDSETGEDTAVDLTEPPQGDWWSRFPTWLLFVLVFVFGSAILVAGVFAVGVLVGPIFDELPDWNLVGDTAGDATTVTATIVPADTENDLVVGECIDDDELDKYLAGDDFAATACGDPHDYEVYFVYEYPPGPYPGDEAVLDELTDVCLGEFEAYVGHDFETSALDFYRVWPGQGLWESGYRIGDCLLFDFDGDTLTGPAYQSGW